MTKVQVDLAEPVHRFLMACAAFSGEDAAKYISNYVSRLTTLAVLDDVNDAGSGGLWKKESLAKHYDLAKMEP